MTEQEFIIEQQKAVERMKRMAGSSKTKNGDSLKIPDFIEQKNGKNEQTVKEKDSFPFNFKDLNINLNSIIADKDFGIIMGLLLLLYSEKGDKLLLLALLYILL